MRVSATTRLVLGLSLLTLSVLLVARSLGLGPDERGAILRGRGYLCETVAVNASVFVSRADLNGLSACLNTVVARNPELLSAAIRREDGHLVVESGNHDQNWHVGQGDVSSAEANRNCNLTVPIIAGEKVWGNLEARFRSLDSPGILATLQNSTVRFIAFVTAACCIPFFLFLQKSLAHLDPSKVVPQRVREALDTIAGGLLVIDKSERIVLANKSFAETLGKDTQQLQGYRASQLPWKRDMEGSMSKEFPWMRSLRDASTQTGTTLTLKMGKDEERTFLVSCSPIMSSSGVHRGVLVSLEDITDLERKKFELGEMLSVLQKSREEVRRKNVQLEILATKDPLTSCLNRRAFYERFEVLWNESKRNKKSFSCIMLDIDHFKSINDRYGHSTGDLVLQKVTAALQSTAREVDVICRYGGEEFCVLLPDVGINDAFIAADRFRTMIETLRTGDLAVTCSFGVSAIGFAATSPQELLDQADQALYYSKHNGRNQVSRWDLLPEQGIDEESATESDSTHEPGDQPLDRESRPTTTGAHPQDDSHIAIPFHAVTALTSALAYRDETTAEHSRRVADLCVAMAIDVMSVSDVYVLEVAALLHDIGKIGVPDAILLKPGKLTKEEWEIMGAHDRIGVEIVSSTFVSGKLVEIIENHHAFYGGKGRNADLPTGEMIPLGARILTIADAYDAMVSDRVYRKGMSQSAAFTELRRCAGTQFDPNLVERFIQVVEARDESRRTRVETVSKETAQNFGSQIERLAVALDHEDFSGLATLSDRLNATARKQGITQVAESASQLHEAACDMDLTNTVRLTNELLELCRSAQSVFLEDADSPNGTQIHSEKKF